MNLFKERFGGLQAQGGWREDEYYLSFFENSKITIENQSGRITHYYSVHQFLPQYQETQINN